MSGRGVRGLAAGMVMSWLCAFAPPLLFAGAAAAQPQTQVQDPAAKYRGLWFQGDSCLAPRGFKLIGRDLVYSGTFDLSAQRQFRIWTYSAYDIHPHGADSISVQVHDKVTLTERVSDRMVSIVTDYSDNRADYFGCGEAGGKNAETKRYIELLRRVEAVLADYDALDEKCRPLKEKARDCAKELVRMADVNADGKLAPAELTQFLRRAVSVGLLLGDTAQDGREILVSADDLVTLDTEAAMFAPFVARTAFANLDFDNDGFLSVDEIAIGLSKEDFAPSLLNGNRLFGAGTRRAGEAYAARDGLTQLFGLGAKPGM